MGADSKVHGGSGANEYAVIVGIERYPLDFAEPLQGPSLDALRFALWLRRRGVPANHLLVLENKCDRWNGEREQAYAGIRVELGSLDVSPCEEPTFENISRAWRERILKISRGAEDAILWLYWSGHGISLENKEELLLCSEVEFEVPTYIYLSELADGLRSGEHGRFSRQRIIIDACSEQLRAEQWIGSGRRQPYLFSGNLLVDQTVLSAVPRGGNAVQDQGSSLFTRSLLLALDKLGGWPEDVHELWRSVTEEISEIEPDPLRHPRLRIESPRLSESWPRRALHLTESLDVLGLVGIPEGVIADVRAFTDEYLGSAAHPALYGGRGEALSELNRWLLVDAGKPGAILCARAGLGKSALILQWLRGLRSSGAVVDVAFFPISSRFVTINTRAAVFETLAAEMQIRHGEPFRPKNDPEANRAIFHELLKRPLTNGRNLLVVVDGLDEAIGWEAGPGLFPPQIPAHVKILVAAREYGGETPDAWLSRLGWHTAKTAQLGLQPLGFEGVRDLLLKMSRSLGQELDGIDALAGRLTELSDGGDPLLVKLYAEELRARATEARLDAGVLTRVPPGLRGLFGLWLEKQRAIWGADRLQEQDVFEFIAACACAKGPLMRQDLRGLAPEVFTNAQKVIAAANHLRRFLIGDGIRTGFTVSHPRLREFFFDEHLDAPDRQLWAIRFLRYVKHHAEAIARGEVLAGAASPYVVRFGLLHFEARVSSPEDLLPTLSRPWFDAWQSLEGTPAGFLRDMRRASELAMEFGREGLYCLVRANLLYSSAATSAKHIGKELFAECLQAGVMGATLGLVIAREADDPQRKVERLVRLADVLDEPDRGLVVKEALAFAGSLGDELRGEKAAVLIDVCERMPDGVEREQVVAEALVLAESATTAMSKASLLTRIVALAKPGAEASMVAEKAAEACLAARRNTAWFCAQKLAELSALTDVPQAQRWMADAIAVAMNIDAPHSRATALTKIAHYISADKREEFIGEALRATHSISSSEPDRQALRLLSLLPLLDEERKKKTVAQLRELLPRVRDESSRLDVLCALADRGDAQDRSACIGAALALARSLPEGPETNEPLSVTRKSQALRTIARLHEGSSRAALLREALEASQHVSDDVARLQGIAAMKGRFAGEERTRLVAQMLETARHILEPEGRSAALCICSGLLPSDHRLEVLAEAIDTAGRVGIMHRREAALQTIASFLASSADSELYRRLMVEAETFFHAPDLIRTLAERLRFLQPDTALIEDTARLVRKILGSPKGAIAAASIAPLLGGKKRQELLGLARSFEGEPSFYDSLQTEALVALSNCYTGAERQKLLASAALEITRHILGYGAGVSRLVAVARHAKEPLRSQLLSNAITRAFLVAQGSPAERAEALALVAEYLPLKDRASLVAELPGLLALNGADTLLAAVAKDWELVCRNLDLSPNAELGTLIQKLGSFHRGIFVMGLAALAPAFEQTGGPTLLRELADAVIEVAKSWP
jgi:hypothetical protein